MNADSIPIVDCHAHFLDAQLHNYPIFQQRSPGFETLVGDYRSLPRRYLPDDYLKDASGLNVSKTIWAEFMSIDPVREALWAENLADQQGYPHGIIALVDFLSRDSKVFLVLTAPSDTCEPSANISPGIQQTRCCASRLSAASCPTRLGGIVSGC